MLRAKVTLKHTEWQNGKNQNQRSNFWSVLISSENGYIFLCTFAENFRFSKMKFLEGTTTITKFLKRKTDQ